MHGDFPRAIIGGSTLERRAPVRKWLAAASVIATAYTCWRLVTCTAAPSLNDRGHAQLVEHLDDARRLVGSAFDVAFERIERTNVTRFQFVATIAGGFSDAKDVCRGGFNDAFAHVVSPYALTFVPATFIGEPATRVDVIATSSRTGLRGRASWLGTTIAIDETSRDLRTSCTEAAYDLIAAMSSWQRPPRSNPHSDHPHASGFAAIQGACIDGNDAACVAALGRLSPTTTGDDKLDARTLSSAGCARDLAATCLVAGNLALARFPGDSTVTSIEKRIAIGHFMRGCDLGNRPACDATRRLLFDTDFYEARKLLGVTDRAMVNTSRLGHVFALRWGQFSTGDDGGPAAWTADPDYFLDGFVYTPFTPATAPASILAVWPRNATKVWAVSLPPGLPGTTPCSACKPSLE